MKFLDPQITKIGDYKLVDYLQFDIYAEDILSAKMAQVLTVFRKVVPKPKNKNKPICYKVTLYENEDNYIKEELLIYFMGLILSSLTQTEPTKIPLVTELSEELRIIYASPLSVLNYINYGPGNPIQIEVTRKELKDGVIVDSEVFYLI